MYGKTVVTVTLLVLSMIPAAAQASSSKNGGKGTKESNPTAVAMAPTRSVSANDPDYVIGPQDTLQINVWKEPEVSGPAVVRLDGKISLPLVNDLEAAGKTPLQLGGVITDRLKEYITDPRVTVIVTAIKSKRIFLMGEVGHQGPVDMLPNMTVLQALASAGGFSQYANLKKIYILRNQGGSQVKIPFNYKEVIRGRSPEQNIVLKPGDTIVVP
jgi:polysaccharide export outer membrane protein